MILKLEDPHIQHQFTMEAPIILRGHVGEKTKVCFGHLATKTVALYNARCR